MAKTQRDYPLTTLNVRPATPPTLQRHKGTGQAKVRIDGRDIYLGKWGSDTARLKYDEICQTWALANATTKWTLTCGQLAWRFMEHAKAYYVKNGKLTSAYHGFGNALWWVKEHHKDTLAATFGPVALEALRDRMIDEGELARTTVNAYVQKIVKAFKWAVSKELIPPATHQSLATLDGLAKGRTRAKERKKVRPVSREHIEAAKAVSLPITVAMIDIQYLTAMRSGELVAMRPCDVDKSGKAWIYRPESHKTEHHDIVREIAIGLRAQEILAPWLYQTPGDGYVFRYEHLMVTKKGRSLLFRRKPDEAITTVGFYGNITAACDRAKIPQWHPHQLRHTRATELRKLVGLEDTQPVLGHETANMTERYAEKDLNKAIEVMLKYG